MAKVREIAWPDEYSDLKRMEEFMVCGICYDYIETSVMTPCSHNYCSLCIRKYLHYKTQCPTCFQVFFEKDLYINRAMDGLIQHYLQVREKVLTLIEHRNIYNKVTVEQVTNKVEQRLEQPSTPPVRPVRNNQLPKSPKVIGIKNSEPKTPVQSLLASTSKCSIASPSTPKSSNDNPSTPTCSTASPSTPKLSKNIPIIAGMFTPKNTAKKSILNIRNNEKTTTVPCPVCKVDIPEFSINIHLDACLQRENQEKVKEAPKKRRATIPKFVLRVMKDAEIKKKMKELGLSIQGDRKVLEKRITKYISIYNSECDKLNPRPVAELIKQCELEERQERSMTDYFKSTANTVQRLQVERNAKEEKIEEAQKNYRVAHKSSFDKLIEEVRNRRKMAKEEEKEEDNKACSSNNEPSTSTAAECVSENVEEREKNETPDSPSKPVFHNSDSDSDEVSCVLQHYENLIDSSSCTSTCETPKKITHTVTLGKSSKSNQKTAKNNKNITKSNKNKAKKSMPRVEAKINAYEVSTDESTDDEDVQNSPISKKLNRKRVKLSDKPMKKSNSSASTSVSVDNEPLDNRIREAEARDLCNSIIDDFSFDDSSNEFADKLRNGETKESKEVKVDKSSKIDNYNQCNLQEENISRCDNNVPDVNLVKANPMSNSLDDFSFDFLNDDNSTIDFKENPSSDSKNMEQNVDIANKNLISNGDAKIEKENDAPTADETSEVPVIEHKICRPLRKRNRPLRFMENQSEQQESSEKLLNDESEELIDSASPEDSKSSASSDNSLKRRRGGSKTKIADHSSDELQNRPKRPVRRRQATTDRNL